MQCANWDPLPDADKVMKDVGMGFMEQVEEEVLTQVAPEKERRKELRKRMKKAKNKKKKGKRPSDMPTGATVEDFKGDVGFVNDALEHKVDDEKVKLDKDAVEKARERVQRRYEVMRKQGEEQQKRRAGLKKDVMFSHPEVPDVPVLSEDEDFAATMLKTIEQLNAIRNNPKLTEYRKKNAMNRIMLAFGEWVSKDKHRQLAFLSSFKMSAGEEKTAVLVDTFKNFAAEFDDDDLLHTQMTIHPDKETPTVVFTNLGKPKLK